MPVFNTELYLRNCLDSILQQTFGDWELIAIDDFSTDGSAGILEEYSQRDSRIHWHVNDEKGIIPALRKAYDRSLGSIIHRMDSDDIMPRNKLKNLRSILCEKGPGSVATGKVEYFSTSWEVRRGFLDYASWINLQIEQGTIFDDIFMECPVASPAWMMFRKDLDAIGGIVRGPYPEDYDLVFRMYVNGLTPYGSEEVVHLWRDWSDRASRTKEEYADQLFFELKLYYFLKYKYKNDHAVVLWGAGRKGKKLFKTIQKAGIPVEWVTENENKTGHNIYGTILKDPAAIDQNSQIIVAVSDPEGKADIRRYLQSLGKENNKDLFFFC